MAARASALNNADNMNVKSAANATVAHRLAPPSDIVPRSAEARLRKIDALRFDFIAGLLLTLTTLLF
ncbi:hypothetical protein CCP2SC5_380030 [Azospirillaceae bacterium]